MGPIDRIGKPTIPNLFDGFEGKKIADFWVPGEYGSGRYVSGRLELQDKIVRSGKRALKMTLFKGDIRQCDPNKKCSERTELDSGKGPLMGEDTWYGFSFYIPEDFPIIDNRLVIGQWKQVEADRPIIAQRFKKGRFFITLHIEKDKSGEVPGKTLFETREFKLGRWYDMVYNIKFTPEGNGYIRAWMNGKKIIDYHGKTAWADQEDRFYNKFGLYRDEWPEPMTIYFDNYTRGKSFKDVDPARFDEN